MSVSSVSELARQRMLSMLSAANQNQKTTGQSAAGTPSLSALTSSGSTQASPFAQMLADLQQLESANPKQYSKVTQTISQSFSTAAGQAQGAGNTTLASQLSALSNDFSQASLQASSTTASSGSHFNPLQFMGGMLSKVAGL